ncbi:MAG: hypothetical protein ACXV5N_13560 [Halobacteriota archaeon]
MKKIAIIDYRYFLANSLSLINSAIILAREGYDVHIFIDPYVYENAKADFDDDRISVHLIEVHTDTGNARTLPEAVSKRLHILSVNILAELSDETSGVLRSALVRLGRALFKNVLTVKHKLDDRVATSRYSAYTKTLPSLSRASVVSYTERFFPSLAEFSAKLVEYLDEDFLCFIGVEPSGLIASTLAADALRLKRRIPVIYYNQELLLDNECHTVDSKALKALERTCNQDCYLTIVQDKQRARYLRDDNRLGTDSVICVPVSGIAEPSVTKGTFLHDVCGIPKGKKVLLYVGTLASWAMCTEMARAAQNWRDDFVLVLHTWREGNDPYTNLIRTLADNNKVFLSQRFVDWRQMPELLSSADIGLAFYRSSGTTLFETDDPSKNFFEIGHSSNKLVQYLEVGLPVITSDFPSLRGIVDGYGCGECAKDPDEIEFLAERIFQDYDRYRANTLHCYESEYDFMKHFKEVVNRIRELERPS